MTDRLLISVREGKINNALDLAVIMNWDGVHL